MTKPWLTLVGIGEDGMAGLSPSALRLVEGAELLVGGKRHLAMVESAAETLAWPSPLLDAVPVLLANRHRRVVVLASGDPFLWGVGATLARFIPASEMLTVPAPSSFALAAARLGWAQQEVRTLSLHARPIELLLPHLNHSARLLALTSDEASPAAIAALLRQKGFGASLVHVLEALGGDRERVRTTSAKDFDLGDVHPLNLVAIEVVANPAARVVPRVAGLPDDWFEHDGQLTKREIRAVTLSALAPHPGDLLWDVGLGAGSVAIEWLLADTANRAIGFEMKPDRAERATRNALSFGVPFLEIATGDAPASFAGRPAPDAIFLGGGLGDGVFGPAFTALKPGGRLVANAVSLESEAILLALRERHGGEMIRLSVERVVAVGAMHGWKPAMPVTQWVLRKPR